VTRYPVFARSARDAADDDADALAIIDGDTRWSRDDLDRRAQAVGETLRREGVGPGARIGLLAGPTAAAIAVLHGIARAGGVAVPLPTSLTDGELATATEVTDPGLIIHDRERAVAARALGRPTLDLENLGAAGREPDNPIADTEPDAPAVIVLTSGTTGRPKAAILGAGAMVASAEAWLAALPPATGWLLAVGVAHVAGLGVVWRAALTGVPLVVLPQPDPDGIVAALRADPFPSHVSLVPTTLLRILDAVHDAPPPPTLRAVLLGGGPIDPALVVRAVHAGWPVVPTYGLTEAGSGVTALPTSEAARHPGSAGRPLPGVRIRIEDADTDGVGEIALDGPGRFSGYLDDPAATHAACTADGWLRTGDLGSLDADGRLTVVDRRLDRIVRGGENVAPSEVEAVLREHQAIADAAVVGRADPAWGHVPVAIIVLRGGAPVPSDDDLAAFCRERLATFKVPVAFERRAGLPRTATGKLRRAELREAVAAAGDPTRITQEQPA
jgi:o-succinylbenzoate---CoA ligase